MLPLPLLGKFCKRGFYQDKIVLRVKATTLFLQSSITSIACQGFLKPNPKRKPYLVTEYYK
jgi:hypothetical protein